MGGFPGRAAPPRNLATSKRCGLALALQFSMLDTKSWFCLLQVSASCYSLCTKRDVLSSLKLAVALRKSNEMLSLSQLLASPVCNLIKQLCLHDADLELQKTDVQEIRKRCKALRRFDVAFSGD